MNAHNLIQDVYDFNKAADLLGKGMDSFQETAYILEEAIEGYEDVFNMPEDPKAPIVTARDWALSLLNQVKDAKEQRNLPMPTEVEEADKARHLLILAISRLSKLGIPKDEALKSVPLDNVLSS